MVVPYWKLGAVLEPLSLTVPLSVAETLVMALAADVVAVAAVNTVKTSTMPTPVPPPDPETIAV
ncbi:MAG: hypothetical protein IPJ28_11195 [Betaproteobacteria bacterium]|nr:hypothetical protein [Betaproteobacteria bacterium]